MALGTLLQNTYTGIERIVRCQMEERGAKTQKAENWHKSLLKSALENGLIEPDEYSIFSDLLFFRHRHVHGYGHMLDEGKLRALAAPVPSAIRSYLQRLGAL